MKFGVFAYASAAPAPQFSGSAACFSVLKEDIPGLAKMKFLLKKKNLIFISLAAVIVFFVGFDRPM